jgi:hypothetical protein
MDHRLPNISHRYFAQSKDIAQQRTAKHRDLSRIGFKHNMHLYFFFCTPGKTRVYTKVIIAGGVSYGGEALYCRQHLKMHLANHACKTLHPAAFLRQVTLLYQLARFRPELGHCHIVLS